MNSIYEEFKHVILRTKLGWLVLVILAFPVCVVAAVDERPIAVETVKAFPNLQWPDWILGLEEGQPQEPRPIIVTGAGDGTNRLFIASQYGAVFVIPNDPAAEEMPLFLDIRDRVQYHPKENEEGFLGMAFHPKFAQNGELFIYYTAKRTPDKPRLSVISRFKVSQDDPNLVDPDSEQVILTIEQPYWNHNGGTIVFGPDGYLYIGLGDGGAGNDPHMNGQNLQTLLGKILRIDVDHKDEGKEYAVPGDNPFAGNDLARGEIWAYGVRNIWRNTFDRETGVQWAGDVGQGTWEEIDIIERGGNYGWNLREGQHSFGPGGSPPRDDLVEPIWDYHHDIGKSVTGGYVYRGKKVPELVGAYIYADFVTGQIWALSYDMDQNEVTANRSIIPRGLPVMTFGEDDEGELYYATQGGDIYKFASRKAAADN
jgi:glucose/arabinose dehydrogenase